MSKTLEAVFDGEVLRPEDKTGLEPNTRYRITIEEAQPDDEGGEHPLAELLALATDMGTPELASRHDLFAHGKLEEHDD